MNSLQNAYLKNLNPSIAITVKSIDGKTVPKDLLDKLHKIILHDYQTFCDVQNGVIYLGKRT